jgi:hypothetical protein
VQTHIVLVRRNPLDDLAFKSDANQHTVRSDGTQQAIVIPMTATESSTQAIEGDSGHKYQVELFGVHTTRAILLPLRGRFQNSACTSDQLVQ